MNLNKKIVTFLGMVSIILVSCSGKTQPYIQDKIQNQVFHIPIHCEKSQVSRTLESIKQIPLSGSIVEIITQVDCDYAYGSRDIPTEVAQALAKKSYKMLILGEAENGGLSPYTSNDWKWMKNLDTHLLINSAYLKAFPDYSLNPDWSISEILPTLRDATIAKYTTPYEYRAHFSGSFTDADIQQCDALYRAPITYSGSQTIFHDFSQNGILGEYTQATKSRAYCYAQVIQ